MIHGWRRLNDLCATLHIVDCGRAAVVWNKDECMDISVRQAPVHGNFTALVDEHSLAQENA